MNDDYEDLLENLDTIRYEMNDPAQVSSILIESVQDTSAAAPLLSLLQHLVLIRKTDPNITGKYLQLIDNVVAQIVLDGKGLDPAFSDIYNIKIDKIIQDFVDQDTLRQAVMDSKEAKVKVEFANSEKERLVTEWAENFCESPPSSFIPTQTDYPLSLFVFQLP